MTASQYERIRLKTGKTWYVKTIGETDRFLRCARVTKDADEMGSKTVDGVLHVTEHMIQKTVITRRTPMQLCRHYGWLIPACN